MLIAGVVAEIEERRGAGNGGPVLSTGWLTGAQGAFAAIGSLSAAALAWGLWTSRDLPFVPDIGTLLAHRAVGDYTLSMSHLFDLTGPSFAALRLPAALAAVVLLIGPTAGWVLRLKKKHIPATVSLALTMTVFFIAADPRALEQAIAAMQAVHFLGIRKATWRWPKSPSTFAPRRRATHLIKRWARWRRTSRTRLPSRSP